MLQVAHGIVLLFFASIDTWLVYISQYPKCALQLYLIYCYWGCWWLATPGKGAYQITFPHLYCLLQLPVPHCFMLPIWESWQCQRALPVMVFQYPHPSSLVTVDLKRLPHSNSNHPIAHLPASWGLVTRLKKCLNWLIHLRTRLEEVLIENHHQEERLKEVNSKNLSIVHNVAILVFEPEVAPCLTCSILERH